MQLPAEAVAATALIEVVRISAVPAERGAPYPGKTVAHWAGNEAVAAEATPAQALLTLFRTAAQPMTST
ncbi:hypothetical protein [Streptomyces sp. NPDC050738]|uniref:hypothetical protein n=1 Tax=Streptomyces sp. NPDC050738 TaxID=3154744 RepID=UPI0034250D72